MLSYILIQASVASIYFRSGMLFSQLSPLTCYIQYTYRQRAYYDNTVCLSYFQTLIERRSTRDTSFLTLTLS